MRRKDYLTTKEIEELDELEHADRLGFIDTDMSAAERRFVFAYLEMAN